MKFEMSKVNGKKFLFAASLAVGLFLIAGQAMAAAYARGVTVATSTLSQPVVGQQQVQSYPMMGAFGAQNNSTANYRPMSLATQSTYMPLSYNSYAGSWTALMAVITTVLIWVVLIQLIFLLAKLLKKHNH